MLAAVSQATVLDVLDGLEPALQAGLVRETDLPGRVQFSHALVADTLAAELSPGRRARLHAAVARALADLRAGDRRAHLAEMAHHALEGAAAGTAGEAVEWSVQAARDASSRLALEDATTWWAHALTALDQARPGDRPARLDLLLELARAHRDADAVEASYRAVVDAIDLAIELDDLEAVGGPRPVANVEGLWIAGEVAAGRRRHRGGGWSGPWRSCPRSPRSSGSSPSGAWWRTPTSSGRPPSWTR